MKYSYIVLFLSFYHGAALQADDYESKPGLHVSIVNYSEDEEEQYVVVSYYNSSREDLFLGVPSCLKEKPSILADDFLYILSKPDKERIFYGGLYVNGKKRNDFLHLGNGSKKICKYAIGLAYTLFPGDYKFKVSSPIEIKSSHEKKYFLVESDYYFFSVMNDLYPNRRKIKDIHKLDFHSLSPLGTAP